jgi:hypothetical protein
LGKINFDGVDVFGVVGETLVGNIIAGNNLRISNTANQFLLDETGATLTNASFTLTTDNNKGKIILNPTQGIKIQNNATDSFTDGIYIGGTDGRIKANYIDILQNARIYGRLEAATGTFSGDLSAAGGTFSGTLQGVDGTFSGTLSGNEIIGADIFGSYIEGGRIEIGSTSRVVISDFQNAGMISYEFDGDRFADIRGFYDDVNPNDSSLDLYGRNLEIIADNRFEMISLTQDASVRGGGFGLTLYGSVVEVNSPNYIILGAETDVEGDLRVFGDIDADDVQFDVIRGRLLNIQDDIISDSVVTNSLFIDGRLPTTSSTSQSIRFQVFGGNLEFSLNGGSFIKVANVSDLP